MGVAPPSLAREIAVTVAVAVAVAEGSWFDGGGVL
jgi:hypothetical protein